MIHTLLQVAGEDRLDILSLLLQASQVVKGVLGLLVLMSLAGWYVVGSKSIYLSRAASRSTQFLDAFWKTARLDDVWKMTESTPPSPVSEVFRAGYVELAKLRRQRGEQGQVAAETQLGDIESIQRALER